MENNWEVDLNHLESSINNRTKAIVINNPSNPCGAVYNKDHLEKILRIAERHKVPIIADEIYGGMTFYTNFQPSTPWPAKLATFHPLAELEPKIPILTCDGISKR